MIERVVRKGALRIIDANLNRSREGLRVCEEIARFVWSVSILTGELKRARHRISDIVKDTRFDPRLLAASRNSLDDIGRGFKIGSEVRRADYNDIFSANMQRVKESLRVLEEFFKLFDERASKRFLTLRFKIYDIEKKAIIKKISSLRYTG